MARLLSQETRTAIDQAASRYPTRLAALLPALHLVQKQLGHVPEGAQLEVAELLDVPPTRVREVVTFYTMLSEKPMGRHVVRMCRNLACHLRGSERIGDRAKQILGIEFGETTPDGRVTLLQDECLASCGTGPALWCDDNFVENLTEEKLETFLASLT